MSDRQDHKLPTFRASEKLQVLQETSAPLHYRPARRVGKQENKQTAQTFEIAGAQ